MTEILLAALVGALVAFFLQWAGKHLGRHARLHRDLVNRRVGLALSSVPRCDYCGEWMHLVAVTPAEDQAVIVTLACDRCGQYFLHYRPYREWIENAMDRMGFDHLPDCEEDT